MVGMQERMCVRASMCVNLRNNAIGSTSNVFSMDRTIPDLSEIDAQNKTEKENV